MKVTEMSVTKAVPVNRDRLARKGLGGRDMAAILGLDRWRSPYRVWAEKLDLVEKEPQNEAMELGLLLEDDIAHLYRKRTGAHLAEPPDRLYRHPEAKWMVAQVDRLIVGTRRMVELKAVRYAPPSQWGDEGTDAVPAQHYVQVMHALATSQLEGADLAALISGAELRVYVIQRDEKMIAELRQIGERFWHEHVLAGLAPDPDGSPETAETLKRLYPARVPGAMNGREEMVATPDVDVAVADWREAKEASRPTEEKLRQAENRLRELVGEARGIVGGRYRVTWGDVEGAIDWRATAADLADRTGSVTLLEMIAREHRHAPHRRLSVRFDGDENGGTER